MLVNIIDVMCKPSEVTLPLHGAMLDILEANKRSPHDQGEFEDVSCLAKLDETWLGQWLEHHSKLTAPDIARTNAADLRA